MPKKVVALSDMQIKNAKPKDKDYSLNDGDGLALLIKSNGSKLWRFRYTFDGERYLTGFGSYPTISLLDAREKRAIYQKHIANGIHPKILLEEARQNRLTEKEKASNTFALQFYKWLEVKNQKVSKVTLTKLQKTFERYILPFIGNKPVSEIGKQEYIEIILRMRDKGIACYAHKTKGMLQQFLNYLEEANIIENAPQLKLKNSLQKPMAVNYPHITDLNELKGLLLAIEGYQGDISTKYALKLAPLVFVRPANIRFMEWGDIDFKKAIWKIPAEKMKAREPHIVPLSRQALEIINEIQKYNGTFKYVFVSPVSTIRALSENTLNMGLMRLGFKDRMVSHGFRHTASTILHEHISEHGYHTEIIERQLAHAERNGVKAAYNHAEYLSERKKLMQWWADFLDKIKF
jgi:integrase